MEVVGAVQLDVEVALAGERGDVDAGSNGRFTGGRDEGVKVYTALSIDISNRADDCVSVCDPKERIEMKFRV
jgi:hypothetical protein